MTNTYIALGCQRIQLHVSVVSQYNQAMNSIWKNQ